MRVYHFLPARYGIENIENRRLKIARLKDLNDPFEMLSIACSTVDERKAWQATKREAHDIMGLVCFSKNWQNPVQWSHYADKHQGLCLGLEVSDHLLHAVTYSRNRPRFDSSLVAGEDKAALKFMETALNTKFSHWRYEQEMRVVVQLDQSEVSKNLSFRDFSKDMYLAEVIVGANSAVSRSELTQALGDIGRDVRCKKARLAFRTFRVVEQKDASLWQ